MTTTAPQHFQNIGTFKSIALHSYHTPIKNEFVFETSHNKYAKMKQSVCVQLHIRPNRSFFFLIESQLFRKTYVMNVCSLLYFILLQFL